MAKNLKDKLAILADAAKYDASCASSGTTRRDSTSGGIGSAGGSGICHAYTPDGRCISLLKILMTNFCIFDCAYCINRVSSQVERARFSPEEVVTLTLEFYRRNYIEGLFLSSGIIRSPDDTMADMVRIARMLRIDHGFKGYIHLKSIPEASAALIEEAGLYADRLSINIELPQDASTRQLAPQKKPETIRAAMAGVRLAREASRERSHTGKRPAKFAPAGQSTQMIIGADASNDCDILTTSARLYSGYDLKRVYYSAFSPIPDSSAALPLIKPPLMREHRLTRQPIAVIPNAYPQGTAVDPQEALRRAETRGKDLLYMGSAMPYKRVELLIRAMQELPGHTLRLLSRYPAERRRDLEALVAPGARVIFHDGVSEEEYEDLLAEAGALVTASAEEGFGLPVIEAQARGVPVVLSDIPIFREVAPHGLHADPTEPGAFAAAVRRLEDLEVRREVIAGGCADAAHYSWEASARRLLELAEQVLRERVSAGRAPKRRASAGPR